MKPQGFVAGRPTAAAVALRLALIVGIAASAIASVRF